jgi:hypothetical protein
VGGQGIEPDKEKKRGGLGQEERPHPDGQWNEVEIVPAVRENDIPFHNSDEAQEKHENPDEIVDRNLVFSVRWQRLHICLIGPSSHREEG